MKQNFSKIIFIFLLGLFSILGITKKWQNSLSWDVFGYHLYLPATFLWHDAGLKDFSRVEQINNIYQNTGTFYQGEKTDNGSWMIKYTMGLAIMEAPFFFVAHQLAPALGYPADGFSRPYQVALLMAHFFYLLAGLIFLRKALLKLFNDKIAGLLLLLLVFGTNFYVMALLTGGMTPIHTLEFSIFSAILYLTIRWHEEPSLKTTAMLGLLIGLATLVRPTDLLVALVFVLWKVKSFRALREKISSFYTTYLRHTVLMKICFLLVLFPQFLYWKTVSGSWILFSYSNNPGEGFEFLSPFMMQVLFSFRKGWLIYTPLMIFAIVGFRSLYQKSKETFWPLFVFFVLNLYVVSSWSCWWYAGCFSQRALVDSYGLMMVPLGFFLQDISEIRNGWLKKTIYAIIAFFVVLNLFQSWQYSQQILDGSRMTRQYYFQIFGKTEKSEADKKYLLIERSTGEAEVFSDIDNYKGRILFSNNFDTAPPDQPGHTNNTLQKEGAACLQMDSSFIYTSKMEKSYYDITRQDHAWIRTTFWYYPVNSPEEALLSLVVAFDHNGDLYKYRATDAGINVQAKAIPGQWNKFVIDYLTPEVRSKNDQVNIYLWLRGKGPVYIDDLKVEAYERK